MDSAAMSAQLRAFGRGASAECCGVTRKSLSHPPDGGSAVDLRLCCSRG